MSGQIDPAFANAYFNLALIEVLEGDLPAGMRALAKYQQLVSQDEGRKADEILQDLKDSLALTKCAPLSTRRSNTPK
jgi:hypothetical protein